ncbi:MAG: cupin domain-containing protein [Solirubrobacteraceae bacterium]
MSEARVESGVPRTAGWFVINTRDARWLHNDLRAVCRFGGEGEAHFDDLGVGLYWLQPGRAMSLYHHEAGQEDFLVLSGECVLVIEGQERSLTAWDFVHCPPRTPHVIVASGAGPALVLAVGARKEKGSARYPVEPAAVRHGAGVPDASTSATEIYARFGEPRPGPAPDIFSRPAPPASAQTET